MFKQQQNGVPEFNAAFVVDVCIETPPAGMMKNLGERPNLSQKIFYISKKNF